MKTRRWAGWVIAVLLGVAMTAQAAPVVSNVRASQREGTKLVDIFYDVHDPNSSSLNVTVAVSTFPENYDLPATSFSDGGSVKSVGYGVSPGNDRWIVWDAGQDWDGHFDLLEFRVTADDWGLYMVVDLSGGPSAPSYPVSYLHAVPAGGWTDEYKTTKLVLRRIPAGTFTMGSPTNELGRYDWWYPETEHQVTLTKDFYIGVFEVTQKQWERVMGIWPSYFTNATYRETRPVEQVSYYKIREDPLLEISSPLPGSAISPNWPQSSQVHADSFMGRLRAKTGLQTFDLPTEAQWEYACRAGTTTALNSGKNLTTTTNCPNMAEVGRYWYNGGSGYSANGDTSVGSAKVGSYLPNAWGLYDMHGNVYEWCLDWYGAYGGTTSDPPGADSGSYRVQRGGCWVGSAMYCRSAERYDVSPYGQNSDVGFRASKTLP